MNEVRKIVHKSRVVGEDMKFTANGETSWPFKAEGDGEIYAVETTNIDTFTIEGNPITLPYPLVNETAYQIAITKTTPGQTSEILFKTRRAVDKTNTINVPDYGYKTIRYIYILASDGVLYKFDGDLLTTANYQGSGVYTTNPLIATINLPALPYANFKFTTPFYRNGFIYVMCVADDNTNGVGEIYMCKINIASNAVTDLNDVANQLSFLGTLGGGSTFASYLRFVCYDFVNDIVYFANRVSRASSAFYNFTTSTLDRCPVDRAFTRYLYNTQSYFDPVNELISTFSTGTKPTRTPFIIRTGFSDAWLKQTHIYDITRNLIYKFSSFWGQISAYTQSAELSSVPANNSDKSGQPPYSDGRNDIIVMCDTDEIRFQPIFANQSNYQQTTISDLAGTHTAMRSIGMIKEDGKKACCLSNSGRVHFFLYDDITPALEQQYYDLGNTNVEWVQVDNKLIF